MCGLGDGFLVGGRRQADQQHELLGPGLVTPWSTPAGTQIVRPGPPFRVSSPTTNSHGVAWRLQGLGGCSVGGWWLAGRCSGLRGAALPAVACAPLPHRPSSAGTPRHGHLRLASVRGGSEGLLAGYFGPQPPRRFHQIRERQANLLPAACLEPAIGIDPDLLGPKARARLVQ